MKGAANLNDSSPHAGTKHKWDLANYKWKYNTWEQKKIKLWWVLCQKIYRFGVFQMFKCMQSALDVNFNWLQIAVSTAQTPIVLRLLGKANCTRTYIYIKKIKHQLGTSNRNLYSWNHEKSVQRRLVLLSPTESLWEHWAVQQTHFSSGYCIY